MFVKQNRELNQFRSTLRYHLGTTTYVLNLIQALVGAGVPVQKLIDKSDLKSFYYQNPEGLIPIQVMYNFFEIVRKDQKIDNMAVTFEDYFRLDKIGAYGEFLVSSNMILSTIQKVVKNEPKSLSHTDFVFNIGRDGAMISNSYKYDTCIGQDFLNDIELGMALRTLKIANKEGWSPKEIHLKNSDISIIDHIFSDHNAQIFTNQKRYGVKFDTLSLSLPLVPECKAIDMDLNLSQIPKNLAGKIELLLDNTSSHFLPSLQQVGTFFNSSTSSIKRTLAAQDQITYKKIVERWRFVNAMKLLVETDLQVKEISDRLYYSNSANFNRAFKVWLNISPYKFRENSFSRVEQPISIY